MRGRLGERPAGAEVSAWIESDAPLAAAAERLVEAIRAVDARRGSARLAISGGSAASVIAKVREELGSAWGRVSLTWADERCEPYASEDSNRGAAYRDGVLGDPRDLARELPLFLDGETPEEAAERVERAFVADFAGALDVVSLGMGPDGHVASLFPGREPGAGYVEVVRDSPKPPSTRLTLTRRALLTAERTVVYAVGEAKRDAVRRVMAGEETLPAVGLPGLVIVTDPSP